MQAQAQASILKRATEEQSLSEYVQRIGAHSERGWALHIHLSKLGPRSRNENLVFALDMFRALVNQFSGRVFMLRSADVICAAEGQPHRRDRNAARRIQMLFHDDPLFHLEHDGELKFSTYYNLNDLPQFQALVERIASAQRRAPECAGDSGAPEPAPPVDSAPLDLGRYAAIVNTVCHGRPRPFRAPSARLPDHRGPHDRAGVRGGLHLDPRSRARARAGHAAHRPLAVPAHDQGARPPHPADADGQEDAEPPTTRPWPRCGRACSAATSPSTSTSAACCRRSSRPSTPASAA